MNATEPSMHGRVCMVTGANGGMGRVIVADLCRRGATVIAVCRSYDQTEVLKRELVQSTGNPGVEVLVADLADQSAIRRLAEEFRTRHSRLDVLVNNAGAHFKERRLSVDGIEMHLAINHLSWFLLTRLLLDALGSSAPSRVVNVASEAASDTRQVKIGPRPRPATLDLDDLQSARDFEPMAVYARSKLAMVMCGYALARRLDPTRVNVNALHPGIVGTEIVADISPRVARPFLGLIRAFLLSPEQGASTAILLAIAPELEGVTGKYFIKGAQARSSSISYDVDLQEKLWHASSKLVGLTA